MKGSSFLLCCKCGQKTRKFVCPKCEHRLCSSCKSPDLRRSRVDRMSNIPKDTVR